MQVFVTKEGRLAYKNEIQKVARISTTTIEPDTWHSLQVRVRVGTDGLVETWLDGEIVAELSQAESLGTALLRRIEIGNRTLKRSFDLFFDDVAVDTNFVESADAPSDVPHERASHGHRTASFRSHGTSRSTTPPSRDTRSFATTC